MSREETKSILECKARAEQIAASINLCSSGKEMEELFSDLGLKMEMMVEDSSWLLVSRPEWRGLMCGLAVYISPFYGVVNVVDCSDEYADYVIKLSDGASRILNAISYSQDNVLRHIV